MQKQYILKSNTNRARMVFRYSKNNLLIGFDLLGEYNRVQEVFIVKQVYDVATVELLEQFAKDKKLTLKVISGALDFESFWNDYGNKDGNRKKAQQLYEKLTESERALVRDAVPRYKERCRMNNTVLCYPDTYLSQERWKNEL